MQWSDVTKPPSRTQLRQFAGLWLVFFGGLAAWRLWQGRSGTETQLLGWLAITLGPLGLLRPEIMRWIYTGWMIAVFPIGWTVSRIILALLYFAIFTPIAAIFRMKGRDALGLKKGEGATYWTTRTATPDAADYLRQS